MTTLKEARRQESKKGDLNMSAQTPKNSREEVLREKRGQGLAARDLVKRKGDHFTVTIPSLRGKRADMYEVSRDSQGRVRCDCPQFETESKSDPKFRCEHIHAVKYAQAKREPGEAPALTGGDNDGKQSLGEKSLGEPSTQAAVAETDSGDAGRGKREREIEAHLNSLPVELPQTNAGGAPNISAAVNKGARVIPLEFTNTLRALRQPVDPNLIKTREGWTDRQGNRHTVEYVEWHTVADILDRICPTWSHAVRCVSQIGGVVAVTAAITIKGVTREGVGTGAADNETGIKKAEHDALKRAAVKFGIARELYQREAEIAETGVAEKTDGSHAARFGNRRSDYKSKGFDGFPQDPMAKGTGDLVTPKQLGMINRTAREVGVNAEKECLTLLGCKPQDLSKRAASSLIDYLKAYPESAKEAARRAG